MKEIKTGYVFLWSLGVALFGLQWLYSLKLLPFAPFLVIIISRSTHLKALWIGALCGFIMDLLSSQMPMGMHTLIYTITLALLFNLRRYFFVEKATGLFSFTLIFSFLITLFHAMALQFLGQGISYHLRGLLSDFIIMPLIDGVYSFIWFYSPVMLYHQFKRHYQEKHARKT